MTKGFDSVPAVGALAPKIKAAGCEFVARYFSRNPRKNLTASETRALSAAGISIVSVWEAAGDHVGAFTADSGTRDANDAMACARLVRQPVGTTIYFAVDLDVTGADLAAHVIPYFSAIRDAVGGKYKIGVYGSGMVCQALTGRALASYAWLGGAMGWAGSRSFAGWHIRQGLPSDPYHFGFQIDPDEARGDDYGQWRLGAVPATPRPPTAVDDPIRSEVVSLQALLKASGFYTGEVDGDPGPMTVRALGAYRAARGK